ncbi:hypothetical protein Hanom_Chr16g01454171 [Helianthus anomalus]
MMLNSIHFLSPKSKKTSLTMHTTNAHEQKIQVNKTIYIGEPTLNEETPETLCCIKYYFYFLKKLTHVIYVYLRVLSQKNLKSAE